MAHYIDKAAVVAEIERKINEINLDIIEDWRYRLQREHDIEVMKDILSLINTLEVKEVSEELAETYMQVFEKKFPILPTLKGKQLSKFKNFLNKCQQIFGLQEFGIRPVQAKLFEKLTLLWAAWGAENLQGIGKIEGEPDVVKEVDLENECKNYLENNFNSVEEPDEFFTTVMQLDDMVLFAKHFFKFGLKAARKRK
jgi:hypothetical protein